MHIAQAFQPASNRTPGAISCAIDGSIKIIFGILDYDVRQIGKLHLDVAAFVLAAARAIRV